MKSEFSIPESLRALEQQYAQQGASAFNSHLGIETLFLKSRIDESNYRKSEALLMENQSIEIERARTFLARGRLDEASAIIHQALKNSLSIEDEIEWLLEKARLCNAEADYSQTIETAERAIQLGAKGPTRMTLHQVLSIAQFEIGLFEKSTQSANIFLTLSELYPRGISIIYARALLVRLTARIQGTEMGANSLRKLWTEITRDYADNLDAYLVFCRTQADLKRLRGQDPLADALAAFQLANKLGDELYADLALLEVYFSGHQQVKKILEEKNMMSRLTRHTRVSNIFKGLDQTTTAKTITSFDLEHRLKKGLKSDAFNDSSFLFFIRENSRVIDLAERKSQSIDLQPRIEHFLTTLGNEKINEATLFQRVWKINRYVPEKHFENIRTVGRRLKAQSGATITRAQGEIFLRDTLVIEELNT